MLLDLAFLLLGFVLLLGGAEALVRGATSLARAAGVSDLAIGLTVVAFATSAPELAVSVQAALQGRPEIALGNVVGSNIANVLLILGLAALAAPIPFGRGYLRAEVPVVLAATAALYPALADGLLGRAEGGFFLLALAVLTALAYRRGRAEAAATVVSPASLRPLPAGLAVCLGLAFLVAGGDRFLAGAVGIARRFGVSDRVIGLTLVAVGTSLPEVATTFVAAFRKNSEIVVGNVLGSNVFNILSILGLTALVRPIASSPEVLRFDLPAALFAAAALVPAGLRGRIGRGTGAAFLAVYFLYCGALFR